MKTFVLLFALCGGLGGCVTMSTPGWVKERQGPVYVLVKTEPAGATVSFPDGTVCESPCRVGVNEDLPMTIARTGYHRVEMVLTKSSPSPLLIAMDPVLRDLSGDFEELDVPELQ
ncbi:hypothetical protein [Parvularcula sp. LCG005]|uniref:hypothetical protein n=1 Tax=Parvularcula sp. LCG005 TaxID=3078805 RepID=UPI0029423BB3|nr:hypothetical protein [Parvularcula sp. LCG005]WOI54661.1 hypothetical protein RUI03_06580 [Parvularcula sp. LCG005]